MTAFVNGYDLPLFFGHDTTPVHSADDPLSCHLEVKWLYELFVGSCGSNCCFIAQIGYLGSAEAWSEGGHPISILLCRLNRRQFQWFEMHHEYLFTAFDVRQVDLNDPIEPTWPGQSIIKQILLVCGCHHYHLIVSSEAVHLNQKLVKGAVLLRI